MSISTTSHFKQTITVLFALIVFSSAAIHAQKNAQYIYGTIITEDNERYTGFMRWGKEEVAWHDIFNSNKVDNKAPEAKKTKSLWGDIDWNIGSIWKDNYNNTNKLFACRFGDIAVLHLGRNSRVEVELKDGSKIKVQGGSNDIGETIQLYDYELGLIKFDWDRIEEIRFDQAPSTIRDRYEPLIYGTVISRKGETFEGFVKWDGDERMGDDELDGDSRNGDQSIPFRSITRIEKQGRGSAVTLQSGRTFELTGSNDVDSGNRGIYIYVEGIGEIQMPWSYFEAADFISPPIGPSYYSFVTPQEISGTVRLFNGDSHSGAIIFDIDEMYDMEILDGNDGDTEYKIPFRNIKRITPKNRSFSLVELRNGQELLLGDTQDVSRNNDGVLILTSGKSNPLKVAWDDIDEIELK